MTPAINTVKKARINFKVHQYAHLPGAESYSLEAARKLNIAPERIFKTLVVELDSSDLVVAIIPADTKLSLKTLAKAAGAKKAQMANPQDVQRSTGYVLGGVSPLGQKKRLKPYLDASAKCFATLFISAGKRGLEIELHYKDLLTLTKATLASLSQD